MRERGNLTEVQTAEVVVNVPRDSMQVGVKPGVTIDRCESVKTRQLPVDVEQGTVV